MARWQTTDVRLGILLLLTLSLSAASSIASQLKMDERLELYNAFGCWSGDRVFFELHGRVFEAGHTGALAKPVGALLGISEGTLSESERRLFHQRAGLFLGDNERAKRIPLQVLGRSFRAGPSSPNGHFTARAFLHQNELPPGCDFGGATNCLLHYGASERQAVSAALFLLATNGLSVVSDIDDTIKISEVRNRSELLKNTFCRPYQAVPGMAVVCRLWAAAGAQFHYVSASPWQLYAPLTEFIRTNGFPEGAMHLRFFRLKDRSAIDLFRSPERHKLSVIEDLLRQFPGRQFVFLGDSGELDPEIYARFARSHPQQVRAIFIRDVTGEGSGSARFQQVFAGMDRRKWLIFNDPEGLPVTLP